MIAAMCSFIDRMSQKLLQIIRHPADRAGQRWQIESAHIQFVWGAWIGISLFSQELGRIG